MHVVFIVWFICIFKECLMCLLKQVLLELCQNWSQYTSFCYIPNKFVLPSMLNNHLHSRKLQPCLAHIHYLCSLHLQLLIHIVVTFSVFRLDVKVKVCNTCTLYRQKWGSFYLFEDKIPDQACRNVLKVDSVRLIFSYNGVLGQDHEVHLHVCTYIL